ncbi:MAG: hypothetical protein RLZZ124_273 [Cyanobacteriota bacterium]
MAQGLVRRAVAALLLTPLLTLLLLAPGAPARAQSDGPRTPPLNQTLQQRLDSWPEWRLPAPLPRPGRGDLLYPDWFEGRWQATLRDPAGLEPELQVALRFRQRSDGAVVGDRAFNAAAIGRALLGDALLSVRDDPRNPNRQLALLSEDRRLESTVVGRSEALIDADTLLADELSLQVLHGPGDPRISRIETLSRYRRIGRDRIEGEQWQASYDSPADGLAATAQRSWRGALVLERLP